MTLAMKTFFPMLLFHTCTAGSTPALVSAATMNSVFLLMIVYRIMGIRRFDVQMTYQNFVAHYLISASNEKPKTSMQISDDNMGRIL